jgi:hypothetical protein
MGRMSEGTDRQMFVIKLNGKIESLNVYFLSESRNTSSALLALTTENSGDIRGMLNIERDSVSVRLSADETTQEIMKANTAQLERLLADKGMSLGSLRLGNEEFKTESYPKAMSGTRSSSFYRAVSAVVQFIEYADANRQ